MRQSIPQRAEQLGRAIKEKLDEQLRCYDTIYALGLRQRECLNQEDTSLLSHILEKKQKYVSRVDRIQGQLAALRQQWDSVKESAPEDIRRQLRALAGRISQVLAQAMGLEKENMVLAEQRQGLLQQKIKEMQNGKTAISGYLNSGRGTARYMDRRM